MTERQAVEYAKGLIWPIRLQNDSYGLQPSEFWDCLKVGQDCGLIVRSEFNGYTVYNLTRLGAQMVKG